MNQINPSIFKIINIALSMSILIYGVVLQVLGKLVYVSMDVVTVLGPYALGANILVVMSFLLYRLKVLTETDLQKRFPLYVVCLSLNEFVSMLGFTATYISFDGNGFPYVANAVVALTGNLLMFPSREIS